MLATVATLRKLKNVLPFHLRKSIAQALVLSKLYYDDVVYHAIPDFLVQRLQRVQKATASIVVGKYATIYDILNLKWLPIKEQRELNILKFSHKALHDPHWPNDLKLKLFKHGRNLRSINSLQLEIPLIAKTFQDQASHLFNKLPNSVRNCTDHKQFCKDIEAILQNRALLRFRVK